MPISVNGANGITFADGSIQNTGAAGFGFKNRIINGAMVIDQRNAGGSVAGVQSYTLDRWQYVASQSGKITIQQNGGSVTPPAGFKNYIGLTVANSYSTTASDYFYLRQSIEGYNIADFNWGTASASPVTVSFWVRGSVTGTYSIGLHSGANYKEYIATYTISAANNWDYKTITIAGPTDGTWYSNSASGLELFFNLGIGTSSPTWGTSTINEWIAVDWAPGYTGGNQFVSTSNGSTLYITGVQIEKGSTATAFDYRDYGREFIMCQRYYQQYNSTGDNSGFICNAYNDTTSRSFGIIQFPVIMRTSPSLSIVSATSFGIYAVPANSITLSSIALLGGSSLPSSIGLILNASGITAGQGTLLKDIGNNASGRIQLSAEL